MKNLLRQEFDLKIRPNFIKDHPYCQYCGKPTQHVHHLIPLAKGGDNRINNLIPLCRKCHGLIHNKNYNDQWKKAWQEGIEKAKAEGKFKGGQIKRLPKKQYLDLKEQYLTRKINKVQFAKLLKISRPTLDKVLKEEEKYLKVMI